MLVKTLTLLHSHTHMSHQETIKKDIMTLLLQLQASHSALERDNGRLVAENDILSTVLLAQT